MRDYRHIQRQSSDTAVAVAAIKALTNVIVESKATTMMGLGKELEEAAQTLIGQATFHLPLCLKDCLCVARLGFQLG